MILELDCGNSLLKWRILDAESSVPIAEGVSSEIESIIQSLVERNLIAISRCRLVSVRSDDETAEITANLTRSLQIEVVSAKPGRFMAGVVNGYRDFERLGLDRWLAVVAAYDICGGACVVIDLGTAVTVDLVASDGEHLGGYITPGLALLRKQLLAHTRRIRYDDTAATLAWENTSAGKSTAEAVERGCLMMLRGYVSSQLASAAIQLGAQHSVFVTGGDASIVLDQPGITYVPDLVFRGLAIACP